MSQAAQMQTAELSSVHVVRCFELSFWLVLKWVAVPLM